MAKLKILKKNAPGLRCPCRPVTEITPRIPTLLDDMKDTLVKAQGAGLAAPQVGVLRRIFVVSVDDKYYECINPTIVSKSGKQVGEEGCLSVKGKYGTVERPMQVTVKAFDRYGKPFTVKAEGFLARAFCHENDHLDGIVYLDKATNVMEESR